MDKEFFENKEDCNEQIVNCDKVIKDLKSKGPEATNAEIREMLDEVNSVIKFVKDRFTEIINKHQSICAVGDLGYLGGVSFSGKPVAFAGVGTKKALDNAFKVIMTGMMSHED